MPATLTFLHGKYILRYSSRIAKEYHDFYSLKLMTNGKVELWYDQKRHNLSGAWFWTTYPGPWIRFHPAPGEAYWEHRYTAFQGTLVQHWKAEGLWFEEPQTMPQGKDYAGIFDELLVQSSRSDRWSTLRATNLLENILIDLAEARAESKAREPWLERVLEALQNQEQFTPEYELLAQTHHMSLSTLRRRFKQLTGTSLHAYVMQHRLGTARDLLLHTDLPVGIIAEQLGYKDVYFFSTQFRQQVGMSPRTYRQSRHG